VIHHAVSTAAAVSGIRRTCADARWNPTDAGGAMEENGRDLRWLLVLALASIIAGGTLDLVLDNPTDWLSFHVIVETLMIAGALVMATTLWLGWWRAEQSVAQLRRSLDQRAEWDSWREQARPALQGLAEAVNRQFGEWGLTPAEREVAMLLLKGYSHKQVAQATHRNERTARQHASAAYHKAGLSGRAELAAYFLEDLMLPEQESRSSR
jgi:DNA-binding CsgD family transcriptional regulator